MLWHAVVAAAAIRAPLRVQRSRAAPLRCCVSLVEALEERLLALEQRLSESEQRLSENEQRLSESEQRVSVLERIAPAVFSIFHYNVLADQYASNVQPWFLYNANVTSNERAALIERFYEKGPAGRYVNLGWPTWAEDILSAERRAAVEAYDAEFFSWDARSERLWAQVEGAACDVVTLAECDHYNDFWNAKFRDAGYSSVWRKRPRASSTDGCAIAWRHSTFELVAHAGVDFADSERGQLDRTFLMALLRFKRNPSQRLLVATTHLARNPEVRSQTLPRGYQYGLLFRELLTFATEHAALEVPVTITGDLNAECVDELSGIAKGVAVATGGMDKVHPVLNALLDAPTPPTTKTDAREMRIDYVLYQTSKLRLRDVSHVALNAPMPNAEHPSDHAPVRASLLFKSAYTIIEANARTWLNVCLRHSWNPR